MLLVKETLSQRANGNERRRTLIRVQSRSTVETVERLADGHVGSRALHRYFGTSRLEQGASDSRTYLSTVVYDYEAAFNGGTNVCT